MDTPYQWTKQIASHWGGTRNGMITHWPNGFRSGGELRSQFHHIIDLAPTILEVAGLPEPVSVNGVQQMPLHGVSMAYTFDGPEEPDRHETQYFEMFGNRGIYTRAGPPSPGTRHPGSWSARRSRPLTTTAGSCTTPPTTGARPMTSPGSTRTSSTSSSGSG